MIFLLNAPLNPVNIKFYSVKITPESDRWINNSKAAKITELN